jgi:hypothetical protein
VEVTNLTLIQLGLGVFDAKLTTFTMSFAQRIATPITLTEHPQIYHDDVTFTSGVPGIPETQYPERFRCAYQKGPSKVFGDDGEL